MRPFRLHRPTSLLEALALHDEFDGEWAWYAGGTELLLAMEMSIARPDDLIDIKKVQGLPGIRTADGWLDVGPLVTHRELGNHEEVRSRWPALARLENRIGNWRVRSSGTLAGNLAFAEPRSDPATFLLACGAEVVLTSSSGSRTLGIADFVQGPYRTARRPEELITLVRIPVVEVGVYVKFQTIERPTLGVAVVGPRAGQSFAGAPSIAVGAAVPQPTLCPSASALLAGEEIDARNPRVKEAAKAASEELDLLDDITGSATFKARLVETLLPRAVAATGEARDYDTE